MMPVRSNMLPVSCGPPRAIVVGSSPVATRQRIVPVLRSYALSVEYGGPGAARGTGARAGGVGRPGGWGWVPAVPAIGAELRRAGYRVDGRRSRGATGGDDGAGWERRRRGG